MRRGQTESISLLTGIIIALLILLSLGFISCSIAKQKQVDVRSTINYDRLYSYLQQCQQFGEKDCYCPLLTFEKFASGESLQLQTLPDGTYLDLKKTDVASSFAHKKVSTKKLCTYEYINNKWVNAPVSTLDISPISLADQQNFMAYIDAEGNLCSLAFFLEGGLRHTEPAIATTITSQLRSCTISAPASSLTFFVQQRHTKDNPNPEFIMKEGQAFALSLQTSLLSLGKVYLSKVEPSTDPSNEFTSNPLYTHPDDQLLKTLPQITKSLQNNFGKKLLVISPLYTQTKEAQEKDSITIYYLKGSVTSKLLAESLQKRLTSLAGKSYINELLLADTDSNAQQHRFAFWIQLEPLDETAAAAKGIFFFQPQVIKQYPQLYQDRNAIPAVFVDFVDHPNAYSLLDKHNYVLSREIKLGVEDYLQQPTTQNIFQQP